MNTLAICTNDGCGKEVEIHDNKNPAHCPDCSFPMLTGCPYCGSALVYGGPANYCAACGHSLKDRYSILVSLISGFVAYSNSDGFFRHPLVLSETILPLLGRLLVPSKTPDDHRKELVENWKERLEKSVRDDLLKDVLEEIEKTSKSQNA